MSDNVKKLRQGLTLIEQEITRLEARSAPQDRAALANLRTQHNALVKQLTGTAAIAQHGSTAQGPNTIHIGGYAEKNTIIQGNENVVGSPRAQTGGVRIGHIKAQEKVTVGVDTTGGSLEAGAKLAKDILSGNFSIDDIEGKNVVVGLRHVKNLAQPTQEELRQEVAHLRSLLEAAIEAGEITDNDAAEDAMDDLDKVNQELNKDNPNEWRVMHKLNSATDVLIKCSETSEAVGNIGGLLLKIAPAAALLTQLAQSFFGM